MNNQINVTGFQNDTHTNYDINHNNDFVEFKLHTESSVSATTTWKDYGQVCGTITSPAVNVQFMEQFGAIILRMKPDGILQYRSITGSIVSANSLVAYALWKKQ